MITNFASSLPGGFHHPIEKTVKTMQVTKSGVKIKIKTVYDLTAVFLTSLAHWRVLVHPKGNKAVVVNRLGVTVSNPPSQDKLLVDASHYYCCITTNGRWEHERGLPSIKWLKPRLSLAVMLLRRTRPTSVNCHTLSAHMTLAATLNLWVEPTPL